MNKRRVFIIALLACVLSFVFAFAACTKKDPDNKGVEVTAVTLDKETVTLQLGATTTITLVATVTPDDATDKTVTWTSSAEAVATVSGGVVTAVAPGSTTITATAGGKSDTCTVIVNPAEQKPDPVDPDPVPVTCVTVSGASEVTVGQSITLTAAVSPDNAIDKTITWKSSDDTKAVVSANGVVTGVAEGSVTITATAGGLDSEPHFVTVKAAEQPPHTHTAGSLWENDATNHWHVCTAGDGYKMNEAAHADTNNDGKCDVCQYQMSTPHTHTAGSTWESDTTNHWHVCTAGDGYKMNQAAHADGNNDGKCDVCQYQMSAPVVRVTSVTISGENQVTVGKDITLSAEVLPANATNKTVRWEVTYGTGSANINSVTGVVTGVTAGTVTVTATADGVKSAAYTVTVVAEQKPDEGDDVVGDLVLTYSYAGNECAAFEWAESNIDGASVKYKATGASSYTNLDGELIRSAATSGTARADIVGLKGGQSYEFVVTSSNGKTATVTKTPAAYDRSGYAHFNYTDGVGAYNNDGTPKSNAQIIYVSEENKNTVTANIGGKNYTGIVSILGNLKSSKTPVIVRVIGTIGAATWNKIDYNADKKYNSQNKLPAANVIGKNGKQLPTNSNTTQADLIAGGYNTLNTSVYSELKGLDSRAKYSSGEYDTIWNNCSIKDAKNVTLEGIGEDARLFQWGITWGSCNSIEVRNLTFEDYPEDACAFEGSTASTTTDGFNSQHLWLHHNTFEEGMNYWDLCAEQDKHEGDGATDFKQLSYLTTSYNVHHKNHKTGLVGGSDTVKTACITFHHNYYNNNSSRLPLGRQANMHMYNNYYYKSTGTNMSLRAGAYAFIENSYFESCNNPIEIKTGDGKSGAAKLMGNVFTGKDYASNSHIYEVTDRTKQVANDNIYNKNFDTDASAFYYDATNKRSVVSVMYTAEETKVNVPLLAGVQKRNGKTAIDPDAGNQGGGTDPTPTPIEPDPTPSNIPTYSQLVAREDKVYNDDFSSTADGTKFAEFNGYNTAGIFSQPDSTQGYASSYTEVRNGKTQQVTNVGVGDITTGGKNTTTVVAFGTAHSVIEGYFEMTTTDVGTKWDLIRFVDSTSGNKFAVRIDTDKTAKLTYTVNGGTAVTPAQSFVWTKAVVYKVYFKIDLTSGKMTVNITDGSAVFSVADISVDTGIKGIQLISSNKGQRYTSIDNVVICAS